MLAKRSSSKVLGKRFTMTVWDTASGSYVFQRRADASLRGASTTKVLTSVGALATLGPDHRFPTTVRAGSTPDEIVLVAGGDPLLSSADLRALATSTVGALGLAPTPTDPPVPADSATPSPLEPVPSASGSASAAPVTVAPAAARIITVRADDSLFSGIGQSRGWPKSYLPRQVRPVGAFARDDRKVRDATEDAGAYFTSALRDPRGHSHLRRGGVRTRPSRRPWPASPATQWPRPCPGPC